MFNAFMLCGRETPIRELWDFSRTFMHENRYTLREMGNPKRHNRAPLKTKIITSNLVFNLFLGNMAVMSKSNVVMIVIFKRPPQKILIHLRLMT